MSSVPEYLRTRVYVYMCIRVYMYGIHICIYTQVCMYVCDKHVTQSHL